MALSEPRFLTQWSARPPWTIPVTLLLTLVALAVLDPRAPRLPRLVASDAAFETVAGIEPDPRNPVRSIVRIHWTSCAGAQDYEVRFWSQDMREVGRHRTGLTNTALFDLEEVWRPVAPARLLHWRVVALENGHDLAASDLRSLRLP